MIFTRLRLSLIIIAGLFAFTTSTAQSQYDGISNSLVNDQLIKVSQFMQEYYKTHDHFPQYAVEIDPVVVELYNRLNANPPPKNTVPVAANNFRTLGNLRMAYDPSIQNPELETLRKNPPRQWEAPPFSITVLSDGHDQFMIWVSSEDMRPLVDQYGKAIIVWKQCVKAADSAGSVGGAQAR